jgi:hypothetical protein
MATTLQEVFEKYPITVTGIAKMWGKNRGYLNQLVNESIVNNSIKKPSFEELEELEAVIRKLGRQLASTRIEK